jgi:membrane protease YdiL (CAAX protease family)
LRRSDPLTSALLVFPLFLIYQAGVLVLPGVHNGADLVTSELLTLLHGRATLYLLLNVGLSIGFCGAVLFLRRSNTFDPGVFLPTVLESAIYALTMGSLIVFVMQDVLHVDPSLVVQAGHPALRTAGQPSPGPLSAFVLSLGAGVHEELVFRVILLGATAWFCQRVVGLSRLLSLALAFLVSAVLFSLAHHVIGGEPFRVGAFVYRILCGLFFATLYETRGLAVAVYTHALYDMYVLILR